MSVLSTSEELNTVALVLDLYERGVGLDLLDEESIANAKIDGGRLVVGERGSECLALSATTETLARTTCKLLTEYATAGAQ